MSAAKTHEHDQLPDASEPLADLRVKTAPPAAAEHVRGGASAQGEVHTGQAARRRNWNTLKFPISVA